MRERLLRLRALLLPPSDTANTDVPATSSFILTVTGQLLQGLARVAYAILVTRWWGLEAQSHVAWALSAATFLVLLGPQPVGVMATKYLSASRGHQDPERFEAVARFSSLMAVGTAGFLAAVGVGWSYWVGQPAVLAPSLFVLIFALGGYNYVRGVRTGSNHFRTTAAWDALSSLVALALLVVVVACGWFTLVLLPLALGYLAYGLAGWPRPGLRGSVAELRWDMLGFSAWTAVQLVAATGLLQLTVLVGRAFVTPTAHGAYTAAVALATPISMLSGSLMMAMSPTVARRHAAGDDAGVRAGVDGMLRALVAGLFPFFALAILWAEPLLQLVYGHTTPASGLMFTLLLLGVSATSYNAANARLLGGDAGGVKVLASANVAGLLVGVLSMFLLGPRHGMVGCAVAFVLGAGVSGLAPLMIVWRMDRMRWGGIVARLGLAYGAVMAAAFALAESADHLVRLTATVGLLFVWVVVARRDLARIAEALRVAR